MNTITIPVKTTIEVEVMLTVDTDHPDGSLVPNLPEPSLQNVVSSLMGNTIEHVFRDGFASANEGCTWATAYPEGKLDITTHAVVRQEV